MVLYWLDKPLAPKQTRVVGFSYGLGSVTIKDKNDKLGLTLGGSFEPGQNFTATAYVENPIPNQTLRLEIPEGLRLVEGAATQTVPPSGVGGRQTSIVTWKVQVERTGSFRVAVHSSTGSSQAKTISIARPDAPSGGSFALRLNGAIEVGQPFHGGRHGDRAGRGSDVAAATCRQGCNCSRGTRSRRCPTPSKEAMVQWHVKVLQGGKFPLACVSSTGSARTKTVTISQVDPRGGNFQLAIAGDVSPGKVFTVTAHVTEPGAGQTLTLKLPPGLEPVEGDELQQVAGADAQHVWKVKTLQTGKFLVGVASSTGITQRKRLVIERRPNRGAASPSSWQASFVPAKNSR